MPKTNLGKGKDPRRKIWAQSLKRKICQYLNGVRISRTSSSNISDNFLLFILVLIFSTSDEHGSHVI